MATNTSDLISEVRAYTARHDDLKSSHHFEFDAPLDRNVDEVDVIFLSRAPAESPADWILCPQTTEISRYHDFRSVRGLIGREKSRVTTIRKMVGTPAVAQTNLFFWSAGCNMGVREAVPSAIGNEHLQFCRRMNRRLIHRYSPKAVIFSGIAAMDWIGALYDLKTHEKPLMGPRDRLAVESVDPNDTKWIFAKDFWGGRFASGEREKLHRRLSRYSRSA